MACEFSAPYSHTSLKNIHYSPNSQYIANINGSNVHLYRNNSSSQSHDMSQLFHIFSCIDKIDKIEFSKDSEYILCGIYNRSTIQIFSTSNVQWRCRINESIAGIVSATWAPDSRHILIESDFGIQLAIWSLLENTSYIIHSPKLNCFAFSDCQRYLVVGHRFECKDHIAVYSTNPWNELNKFRTRTTDLVAVQWTPGGTHIVVLDTYLNYRVMVYTPAGEIISQYEAYQNALGIRTISFHHPEDLPPNSVICPSQLLAIGSYDGQIRLLSSRSWKLAFVLPLVHPSEMVDCIRGDVVMTVEVIESENTNQQEQEHEQTQTSEISLFSAKRTKAQAGHLGSSYVTKSLKALPRLSPSHQQPKNELQLPKFGVSWIGWSSCGQYLAAREESYPRCLWIWHGLEARLCDLLVQLDNISCARWRPFLNKKNNHDKDQQGDHHDDNDNDDDNDNEEEDSIGPVLAFCCNTPRVYFWTLQGSSWADLPQMLMTADAPSKPSHRSSSSSTARSSTTHLSSSLLPQTDEGGGGLVDLSVTSLKWSPDGKQLILIGKDRYCSCDVTFSSSLNTSHETQFHHRDEHQVN